MPFDIISTLILAFTCFTKLKCFSHPLLMGETEEIDNAFDFLC